MNFFMAVPPCVFATRGRSIPGSLIPLGAAHLPAAALHVANGALRNHLKNQAASTGFWVHLAAKVIPTSAAYFFSLLLFKVCENCNNQNDSRHFSGLPILCIAEIFHFRLISKKNFKIIESPRRENSILKWNYGLAKSINGCAYFVAQPFIGVFMSICCLILGIILLVMAIVVSVLFLCFCKNKTVEKCSIENIFSSFLCFLFLIFVSFLLFVYFLNSENHESEAEVSSRENSSQVTTSNNLCDCCKIKLECCHE